MKKQGLLAASIAVALVGCGSDSDSSNPTTFSITAIDGYLANANVSVDSTQDGVCDLSQGKTDNKGQANLSLEYRNAVVCVDAVAGQTVDSNRGLVQHDFTLANAGSGTIINPMTNMVNKLLAEDSELTVADAEEQVVAAITGDGGLEVSQALIFGDYIADTTEQAEALNLIGEVLVDHSDQDIETKLKLTQAMAEATQEIIEADDQTLDDYSPIIDIPPGGGDIIVTPNTRPKVVGTTEPVELTLGEAWRPNNVSDKFKDAEGDDMTFTMVVVDGDGNNGLSIDSVTGFITGEPENAGSFVYHIFATDTHDARSYPLTFEVTVLTDNQPPVVDEGELANLQSTMNTWMLTEGESLTDTLDVSALFTDKDGDDLEYKVETTLSVAARTGFNALVNDEGTVSFTGLIPRPAAAGAETLTVSVNDGVNSDWISATLSFPIIEEAPLPPVDGHPLENHTWHFLEWGSDDGSDSGVNEATRVWCDSVRFSDGKVYFNQRSLDNLQSCGEADQLETSSSYIVKDDVIEWSMSWEDEEDGIMSETVQLKIAQDADDLGQGAKMVLMSFMDDEEEHQRLAWYVNKSDVEARITLDSDMEDEDEIKFAMYLPGAQEGQYELGNVFMSMGLPHPQDQGRYDANLFFSIPEQDITCDDIGEFYETFFISGYDIDGKPFQSHSNGWGGGFECYDNIDNEGFNYAGIDFDIYEELDVGEVYSFIGIMKFEELEHLEEIKFNMTWEGIKQ